jgi:hypothetical protein
MGLKGYRLWDMGQLDSTCSAPPRRRQQPRRVRIKRPVHTAVMQQRLHDGAAHIKGLPAAVSQAVDVVVLGVAVQKS